MVARLASVLEMLPMTGVLGKDYELVRVGDRNFTLGQLGDLLELSGHPVCISDVDTRALFFVCGFCPFFFFFFFFFVLFLVPLPPRWGLQIVCPSALLN